MNPNIWPDKFFSKTDPIVEVLALFYTETKQDEKNCEKNKATSERWNSAANIGTHWKSFGSVPLRFYLNYFGDDYNGSK